jgi:HSP20 family protein
MRMLIPLSNDWSWQRQNLSPLMMDDAFVDFDRVVDSFLKPALAKTVNFQPSCDISETDDHYLVSFDMPGVKKDDLVIEVKNNQLIISGERRRHEKAHGKFERTFNLPTTVNVEKIEAQYEDGVLNIALPKADAAKARTIEIQNGRESFFSKLLGSKKEETKSLKEATKVS